MLVVGEEMPESMKFAGNAHLPGFVFGPIAPPDERAGGREGHLRDGRSRERWDMRGIAENPAHGRKQRDSCIV
jgi:hypothetical protein